MPNQVHIQSEKHDQNSRKPTSYVRLPAGVITAALTPLDKSLNADHAKLVGHLEWLFQRGNDAIGLLGTTGEANSFSVEERIRILDEVIGGGIDPAKLLVGTGCSAMTDTIKLTLHAASHKVGGILVLPPFYYKKVSEQGLESYYSEILDRVGNDDIEMYLYHFPQLTGISFTINLVERLVSKFPENIIGMKDSGGDLSHMYEIIRGFPGFRLYAGSEKFLLPTLKAGSAGCISATANVTSPMLAAVYEAWKKGGGENEQAQLIKVREVLENYPVIGALKYLFSIKTGNSEWLNIRPPNMIISEDEGRQLEKSLEELEFSF